MILGANFVNLFYLLKSGKNGPSYATVSDAQSDGAITIKYPHHTTHLHGRAQVDLVCVAAMVAAPAEAMGGFCSCW